VELWIKRGTRRRDRGGESDTFPSDGYSQAIPRHRGNPRPQPASLISSLCVYSSPFSLRGEFVTFCIMAPPPRRAWTAARRRVEVRWRD